jgi:hypothetical protein
MGPMEPVASAAVVTGPDGSATNRPPAHIDVCFDTNVILEMSTIIDLNRAATSSRLVVPYVTETRRSQARASLAAAWLCQTQKLTSFSLRHEVEHLLRRLAPNKTPDGDHAWFFTWFLKDYVLPDWSFSTSEEPQVSDAAMSGNARDRHLVSIARDHHAPLVSNELKPEGAIARAASQAGVQVLTPAAWVHRVGHSVNQLSHELLTVARAQMLHFICDRQEFQLRALENCSAYIDVLELILDASIQPQLPDPMDGWRPQILTGGRGRTPCP